MIFLFGIGDLLRLGFSHVNKKEVVLYKILSFSDHVLHEVHSVRKMKIFLQTPTSEDRLFIFFCGSTYERVASKVRRAQGKRFIRSAIILLY